jgi:hypothetical protein
MISVRGIYKIPQVRHIFFIVEPLDIPYDSLREQLSSKQKMEYFEHILRLKHHRTPKEAEQWTLKIVPADDFLSAIKQCNTKGQVSSNQSSHNPEELELLAINLVKTPPNSVHWTFNTPKVLSGVPDEDIIEVFI